MLARDVEVSWNEHEEACFEFVTDDECPKRRFFLGVLYLMVGDAVRGGYSQMSELDARDFVGRGSGCDPRTYAPGNGG